VTVLYIIAGYAAWVFIGGVVLGLADEKDDLSDWVYTTWGKDSLLPVLSLWPIVLLLWLNSKRASNDDV
jgi:RsiW-degrading membrane proteinase PrsW (M82 family)